jgi:hypothetical protein
LKKFVSVIETTEVGIYDVIAQPDEGVLETEIPTTPV